MTYTEWVQDHNKKVAAIYNSLRDKSPEAVYNYFMYDNMKLAHPTFCPLYKLGTKCHNMEKLNCFNCACPHFKLYTTGSVKSSCSINSKYAKQFTTTTETHCDCSDCTIPHTKTFTLKTLQPKEPEVINDTVSLLEYIRNYQLWTIFGKYKLF